LVGVPEGLVAGLTGRPHAVAGSLDRLPADNSLAGGKTSIQPIGHKTTQKRKTMSSYCLRGGPTTIIYTQKVAGRGDIIDVYSMVNIIKCV
jgi:hypothetical protein